MKENKRTQKQIRPFTTWIKNQIKLNRIKFYEKKRTTKKKQEPFLDTKRFHVETQYMKAKQNNRMCV